MKKRDLIIITVVLIIFGSIYLANNLKPTKKELTITPADKIEYFSKPIINENYKREGDDLDGTLNLTNLFQEKTNYFNDLNLKSLFYKNSIKYASGGDFSYFADDDNILILSDHKGFDNSGETILKGGIYNINLKTKEVSLFDYLDFETAKKEKLYVCTDGLRVLTNNYYRPPNGEYINKKDKNYPWQDYNRNKPNGLYQEHREPTQTRIGRCMPFNIKGNTYKEYKGDLLNFAENKSRTHKINNKDLYYNIKAYNSGTKNAYWEGTIFSNDKILLKTKDYFKVSLWDDIIYKTTQVVSKKDGVCYKIENLNSDIAEGLLCPYRHLNKMSDSTLNINKTKHGYIIYKKSGVFPDKNNLALYDENLKFKRYLVTKNKFGFKIKNLEVSPNGCGIIFEKIPNRISIVPFEANKGLMYMNICNKEN